MLKLGARSDPSCNRRHGPGPRCNVVGTLGNHEFDEGQAELTSSPTRSAPP